MKRVLSYAHITPRLAFHQLTPSDVLAQFDQAIETTRRTARGEQGRICVGVTPTSPFHPFVLDVIRAFRRTYPLVNLAMEECHSNELIDRLRSGSVDVAFIRTPPVDKQGLLVNALLPLKALAKETFIIQGSKSGLGLYASTIAACHAAGFSPRFMQEASRLASTLSLVAVGLGVSIVPASMQRMQVHGVAYRRLKSSTELKAPLLIATRRADASAVVRHFLNLIKDQRKSLD